MYTFFTKRTFLVWYISHVCFSKYIPKLIFVLFEAGLCTWRSVKSDKHYEHDSRQKSHNTLRFHVIVSIFCSFLNLLSIFCNRSYSSKYSVYWRKVLVDSWQTQYNLFRLMTQLFKFHTHLQATNAILACTAWLNKL